MTTSALNRMATVADIDRFELAVDQRLVDHGVHVGFLLLAGVKNHLRHAAFARERQDLADDIQAVQSKATITRDPYIAGYRDLHSKFGVTDKSLVPSPESLFAILFKLGKLAAINPIVDTYNYVALKRRVSCGAHDIGCLEPGVRLSICRGGERFVALGRSQDTLLSAGEYAYLDGQGTVICRLECKQAAHSAVGDDTRDVLIIVQGNPAVPRAAIAQALAEIAHLLRRNIGPARRARQVIIPCLASERQNAGSSLA